MTKHILAIGLDPSSVDLSANPELTPELVKAFIEAQLERVRVLGYGVVSCLLEGDDRSQEIVGAPATS